MHRIGDGVLGARDSLFLFERHLQYTGSCDCTQFCWITIFFSRYSHTGNVSRRRSEIKRLLTKYLFVINCFNHDKVWLYKIFLLMNVPTCRALQKM